MPPVRFTDVPTFGHLGRVDSNPNATVQAADHNNFADTSDAMRTAGVNSDAAADALAARTATLEASPALSQLAVPMAGMHFPHGALQDFLTSTLTTRRVLWIGDSVWQNTTDGNSYAQGGKGTWAERFAVWLSRRYGPIISPGLRPIWMNNGSGGLGGTSYAEYSTVAGSAFTLWPRTDASDVAPFGKAYLGSHATDILVWTKPTVGPASWWGRPIVGFELVYIDAASATAPISYSTDGGVTYKSCGVARLGDNKLKSVYIAAPISSTVQIRYTPGSSVTQWVIVGIRPYWTAPFVGANSTDGFVLDNLGHDSQFLSVFANSASPGDPLAIINNVVTTQPLPTVPQLIVLGFTNDVSFFNLTTWAANLNAVIDRAQAAGAAVILVPPFEQSGRDVSNQAAQRASTQTVAATRGVGCVDWYEAMSALGMVGAAATMSNGYTSLLHPLQPAANDMASRLRLAVELFS